MNYTKVKELKNELKNKGINTFISKEPSFDGWNYALYDNKGLKLNIKEL